MMPVMMPAEGSIRESVYQKVTPVLFTYDGEADAERVGKPPVTAELLLVAKLGQPALVLIIARGQAAALDIRGTHPCAPRRTERRREGGAVEALRTYFCYSKTALLLDVSIKCKPSRGASKKRSAELAPGALTSCCRSTACGWARI